MKPIRAFLPREISPFEVAGPSASTWPAVIVSPTSTIGRWFTQVPWFERLNFVSFSLYSSPLSRLITTSSAETEVTTPSYFETTHTPESTAALYSIPVPTIGLSVLRSGTACLCMFEPMRALFASSFSRNGIIAVATETTILGDTSMKSTISRSHSRILSLNLAVTFWRANFPSSVSGSFAWATT